MGIIGWAEEEGIQRRWKYNLDRPTDNLKKNQDSIEPSRAQSWEGKPKGLDRPEELRRWKGLGRE